MKRDFRRGSVSVFLVLILVPCIVVSSLFVDISRVKLGQGVANASADMALNSLMSHYDKDLSQFYGLMASCQNIEDFYEESAQYFLDALRSQKLSDDDIDSLIALYSSVVGDDTIYDLLLLENKSDTTSLISAVDGANLGESSILIKDQIVDFMKYRGPIKITEGIIQRFKDNNVASQTGESSDNEKLVNKKQDYAQAEADMLDACYKSYLKLKEYVDAEDDLEDLSVMAQNLSGYKQNYKEVNRKLVEIYGTSSLSSFNRPTYSLDAYLGNYKVNGSLKSNVYSKSETVDGVEKYYINNSDLTEALQKLTEKKDEFVQAKNNVIEAAGSSINQNTGTGNSDANAIRWLVKVNDAVNSGNNSPMSKFKTAAEAMLKEYSKLTCMLECEREEDVTDELWNSCSQMTLDVKSLHGQYLKAGISNSSDKYLKLVSRMETTSASVTGTVSAKKTEVTNTVKNISDSLNNYKTDLEECVELLDIVINGQLFPKIKSLDDIKTLVSGYSTSIDNWEEQAEAINDPSKQDEMADEDLVEIAAAREQYKDITPESVEELKTRLGNIKAEMIKVIKNIDGLKYGNKKIINIKSYDDAYNAMKNSVSSSEIPIKNGELSTYADNLFNSLFKDDKPLSLRTGNTYNSDLSVDTPSLYELWRDKYKHVNEDTLQDKQDEVDSGKNKGNTEADRMKGEEAHTGRASGVSTTNIYGNENYVASEFPSGLDAGSPYGLMGSILTGISELASDLVEGRFVDDVRDALYSTEYVMDMFSYATYENEGKYHLYMKDNSSISDNPDYSSVADAWKSEAKTDTYNKSLTNRMINTANNVAFGSEAEYVLYGKTNVSNVCSAYVDIYSIRYPLNLVSGFQNFWKRGNTTANTIDFTANSIASVTQGIIPAPLTKSVLILLLTAFETGIDLNRLQNGLPVEIYKKEADWRLTLDGWSTKDSDSNKDNTSGLFYSDYLYIFLYLGFTGNSASEMYLRVGDLIQANMRVATGSSTYKLKNARSYFQLNAKIRVHPLMLTLPYSIEEPNNPKDKEDWCTFDISQIRGYS